MRSIPTKTIILCFLLAACKPPSTTKTPTKPPEKTEEKSTEKAPSADSAKPVPEPVAVGKPSDTLIPREVFFGNPERTNVQMSPDGKQLSWLAAKDGVMNVWVAPLSDLAAAKAVTADATRPVRSYFWAYNNTHLLYTQDKAGNENFHVFSVELSTGKATDLTPPESVRAMIYQVSHKAPNKIIVGMNERDPKYHDAYEIDITTAEKKLIAENKEEYASYVFDDSMALRFASKTNEDGGETIFEKTKDGWKEKLKIPSEDSFTTQINGFNKKGTAVYLSDSRDRNTAALYELNLKTGKKKLLFEDAKADVSIVELHPTENTLQAVSSEYERVQWKVFDKKVQLDFEALAKVSEGDFYITSRSLDDSQWIVVFRSDRAPGKYYKWERKKKAATFLFSDRPALDALSLAKMHPQVIKSRDGLELVSYLTLPNEADADADGKPEKPTPMVLLVHGGPWARDRWGNNGYHQLLANRGYAVLSVNFRGSTGLGKKFLNEGNGQWGKKSHDDLLDAVDWAVANNITPKDKVCIMGGSYGGYATLVGLSMTPDVFACGVDIVGPSSIPTLLSTIPPYWTSGIAQFKTRVGDWTTEEGKKALLEVSPLTHASKIKRPLLIAQGANDPRVKQAESDQIVKAMQEKKIPVSYVLFPDEGHGFARPENNIAFVGVAEAFLSAHLGGFYQPLAKETLDKTTMKTVAGKNGIPGL